MTPASALAGGVGSVAGAPQSAGTGLHCLSARSFVLECWYPVADCLSGFRWHRGPDRRANLVQGAAGGLWNAREVFVHALWGGVPLAAFFIRSEPQGHSLESTAH